MGRWNIPGIPHKGWSIIGCEDILDGIEDPDNREYETCEMCGQERIRYVHIMCHPNYPNVLRVGCSCAEKMTDDYETPRDQERKIQNRAHRRVNFLKQNWETNNKGNLVLRYKGERITAIKRNGGYGFVYNNRWVWDYKGRKICDLETLKMAAFDAFDNEYE